jgi:glycine/D-amino acid oxidase-like deaminating enzyme
LVIDCTGVAAAEREEFRFVPWEFSKGEVLAIAVDGLVPDVVLNRRHWLTPVGEGRAWVGATQAPGERDGRPSAAARDTLERSARALLGERPFAVTGQRAGVRVNLPDKRPVAGRHPERERIGLINGLGSKGGLWAPWLARQWVEHLVAGKPFDPEIDLHRFARG